VNLAAARDELASRGFDYLDSSRMNFMLNDAKNLFEDAYPFPWLEATTTGTSPLSIADLKAVLYVRDDTNDTELLGLPAQQIVVLGDDIAQTGTATHWWLDGEETLTVWPVSSASLQVRYVKESVELSADADTPLIPSRYHSTWLDIAVIRAYIDSDNYAAASGLKQIVDLDLSQIIQRYALRNRQNGSYQTIRYFSEDW
jgi:hypothetical protein